MLIFSWELEIVVCVFFFFFPHFGTCWCSNCWDQIPRTCHVFTRLFTSRIPLGTFSILLTSWKPTYNLTDFSASKVLDNHKSVLTSFGMQTTNEELDLHYIYWIQKMHKNPYKHIFIAGSSKCSTKLLSILLTELLTHIKQGLQKYCETSYSRSGVNQMWILKIQNNY